MTQTATKPTAADVAARAAALAARSAELQAEEDAPLVAAAIEATAKAEQALARQKERDRLQAEAARLQRVADLTRQFHDSAAKLDAPRTLIDQKIAALVALEAQAQACIAEITAAERAGIIQRGEVERIGKAIAEMGGEVPAMPEQITPLRVASARVRTGIRSVCEKANRASAVSEWLQRAISPRG